MQKVGRREDERTRRLHAANQLQEYVKKPENKQVILDQFSVYQVTWKGYDNNQGCNYVRQGPSANIYYGDPIFNKIFFIV